MLILAVLARISAEESLSPAAQAVLDNLKALPESERNSVFKQLGAALPVEQSKSVTSALKSAEDEKEGCAAADENEKRPSQYSLHFQTTIISQKHDSLEHAPYEGTNSLKRKEDQKTSLTSTLYWGRRLWEGGEIYFNPEVSGGQGLSKVLGIAGFPNGDIERVGSPAPTPYIARLFLRQTFNLGGENQKIEDDLNQIAGERTTSRVTVQLGKTALTDVFDANGLSHDPRSQFMNWSLMDDGAWDFPADVRGYTPALSIDWNNKDWALRYAIAMVVRRANAAQFDWNIPRAHGQVLEFERRYSICDKSGNVRAMAFANDAHMGSYERAENDAPNTDTANGNSAATTALFNSRSYRTKYGFGINAEQQLLKDIGGFLRASWNDGRSETWMYTEIDRSVALGATVKGSRWGRPEDVIGVAGSLNGLSTDHANYLKAGGIGFIVGDGKLNYTSEKIIETYYSLALDKSIYLTVDYQHIGDPAYNHDRGPVNIGAVRFHFQY